MGNERKRGLSAYCRTAGSSLKSQLPRTGWEFHSSASLPQPSWRWARESWRNGRYTPDKNAKNNIWNYIKKAHNDTHRKNNLWAGAGAFSSAFLFFRKELKSYDTLGLNRGLNCTPSVGGLNLSASTQQLAAQWDTTFILNCLMHYLPNNRESSRWLQQLLHWWPR